MKRICLNHDRLCLSYSYKYNISFLYRKINVLLKSVLRYLQFNFKIFQHTDLAQNKTLQELAKLNFYA